MEAELELRLGGGEGLRQAYLREKSAPGRRKSKSEAVRWDLGVSASEQGAGKLGTAPKGPSARTGRPRGTGTLDLAGCSERFWIVL